MAIVGDLSIVLTGLVMGTLARVLLLKSDYRSYPSSPNGVLIHLTIGFVAAALGAVAVPALVKRDFVAVTFLALAIQQLREVRRAERRSLSDLERTELVPRGLAYIDGLAKGFEARNYVAMLVAVVSAVTVAALPLPLPAGVIAGAAAGAAAFAVFKRFTGHHSVGEVAEVSEVALRFEGSRLYVADAYLVNVGLQDQRDRILREGVGVRIRPTSQAAAISLANFGQRQAVIHEVARTLGLKRFYGIRRDFETGDVLLYLIPMRRDVRALIDVIRSVPLLESTRREPHIDRAVDKQGAAGPHRGGTPGGGSRKNTKRLERGGGENG